MTIPVLMPKVGLTMTEGKIVEWKKVEGERVEKGEILFVFETEKVTFEVEAQQSGFLAKILAGVDEVVSVGKEVGILSEERGQVVEPTPGKPEPVPLSGETRFTELRAEKPGKIRATPMARRLARERGLDLENIASSSAGGRIRMKDVEATPAEAGEKLVLPPVGEEKLRSVPSPESNDQLVKLSGMRKIIAQKMLTSKVEAAQTYMVISVDATKLLETREKLKAATEKSAGVRLTITDILMKITASAIAAHPVINTRWSTDGILWIEAVHMGMAMALDEGLIVPVIRDIGDKSLSEIAKARVELVGKGKAGKLTPDEMRGSTFTLSSLGMYGIEEFTAIINQPESAILAVGAILDKPVVIEKEIVIRPIMKVTLSYDHRVIDGAKAAVFMKTLKELIEDPILILA
ncbi:MAG: dihydrolipoamide acetyltransferase family protein [Syntrophobacteraceae bacterium]